MVEQSHIYASIWVSTAEQCSKKEKKQHPPMFLLQYFDVFWCLEKEAFQNHLKDF